MELQNEKGQRTDPWRTPADGEVEEGGRTQMKDNYDYRVKEVFIRKQPGAEGPNLHCEKDLQLMTEITLYVT